ncbi:hypothetical protein ACHAWF_013440 [Thalassiosira exigua]
MRGPPTRSRAHRPRDSPPPSRRSTQRSLSPPRPGPPHHRPACPRRSRRPRRASSSRSSARRRSPPPKPRAPPPRPVPEEAEATEEAVALRPRRPDGAAAGAAPTATAGGIEAGAAAGAAAPADAGAAGGGAAAAAVAAGKEEGGDEDEVGAEVGSSSPPARRSSPARRRSGARSPWRGQWGRTTRPPDRRGPGSPPPGTEGAVFVPGASGSSSRGGEGGGRDWRRRRRDVGRGREIIVAEMLDMEEEGEGGKRRSVLDGPSGSRDGPSLFDDDQGGAEGTSSSALDDLGGLPEAYLYDSDSSVEAPRGAGAPRGGHRMRMPPTQLPFPPAPHQRAMYDCQAPSPSEDEKKSDGSDFQEAAAVASSASSVPIDPPLRSPFLDLDVASDARKRRETASWFLVKLPTRLPHLDASSASASAPRRSADAAIKAEPSEGATPDAATSAEASGTIDAGEKSDEATGAAGYDDSLKDAAAGLYGRIVVRRSGRTELVVGGGGGDGRPEVRLLVHEGLRCGFRQEAACIDPNEAAFVCLGDVDKSLVVTPDIERAFAFS